MTADDQPVAVPDLVIRRMLELLAADPSFERGVVDALEGIIRNGNLASSGQVETAIRAGLGG